MKKLALQQICVIIMGLFLCIGCSEKSSDKNGTKKPISEKQEKSVEVKPEVIFATADDKPLYSYIESRGVVEANREIQLKPRISGYVENSYIIEGRRVKKGETLLTFVDEEFRYALQQAKNQYKQAKSEYKIESRSQGAVNNSNNPRQSAVRNDTLVRIFTGFASAEINLKRAEMNFSHTTMSAPFSGKLATSQRLTPGSYINAGKQIGRLVDDRTVRIRFDVLEAEMNKIQSGMKTELVTPGGDSLLGTVEAVSPVVDTRTKTGQIIVKAANYNGTLRPGMTVDGRIRTQSKTGKARIPRSAVLSRDGGRTLVFKLHPQTDEVEWIYVKPVVKNSEWAIVNNENIAPGDTLAVDKHFALSHLQKVTPKMQPLQRETNGDAELEDQ